MGHSRDFALSLACFPRPRLPSWAKRKRGARKGFRQFEERCKLSAESRPLTIKKLPEKSPSLRASLGINNPNSSFMQYFETYQSPVVSTPRTQQRKEIQKARDDLSSFLSRHVPPAIAVTISKSLSQLTANIYEPEMDAKDHSDAVQAYYSQLDEYLKSKPFFQPSNLWKKRPISASDVLEAVERYICTICYERLFSADSADEVADLSLQERIRSLHWVTVDLLGTRIDLSKAEARNRFYEAVNEMFDINKYRRVEEKLQCILRCSQKIFDSLRESGAPTSADEFVPALIYALLKGNPPLIQSNINFISRFALPSRTTYGELAYFFTNFSCTLHYIQNINHESLKISKDEFEAYASGELVPPPNKAIYQARTMLIEEQKQLATRIDEIEWIFAKAFPMPDDADAGGMTVSG